MTAAADLRLEIDRIRIEGGPAALRDGAAFSRALDAALRETLAGIDPALAHTADLGRIRVRVAPGAGPQEIARTVAQTIAQTLRGG